MTDDGWLYVIEPIPFPEIRSWKCVGCSVTCYEGVIDASSHWPWCTIMHPPLPLMTWGGLLSGL